MCVCVFVKMDMPRRLVGGEQFSSEPGVLLGLLGPHRQGAGQRWGRIVRELSEPSVSSGLFEKWGTLSRGVQYLSDW